MVPTVLDKSFARMTLSYTEFTWAWVVKPSARQFFFYFLLGINRCSDGATVAFATQPRGRVVRERKRSTVFLFPSLLG
jgi:hypothetical protein